MTDHFSFLKKERIKEKLTKENMVVVALLGLLLLVIAIPTGKKDGNAETSSGSSPEAGTWFDGAGGSGYGSTGSNGSADSSTGMSGNGSTDLSEEERYALQLEARLEELLSSMDGVGEVKVMVTLEASSELVVEKDVPSDMENVTEEDSAGGSRESVASSQQESTVYITDADGGKTPYVVMTRVPSVEGVTVVAQGGGNGVVQKNITEVIEALFDIEAHKIRVVKMK